MPMAAPIVPAYQGQQQGLGQAQQHGLPPTQPRSAPLVAALQKIAQEQEVDN